MIIATGSPYYGRMAYNLAITIKAIENIPVCVLCNGSGLNHLSETQRGIFDKIINIEESSFAAKLKIYKYSPFEETLYFDADMVWLPKKKPSELFEQMKEHDFACMWEGYKDFTTGEDKTSLKYYYWCNTDEAKEKYNLTGKIYQTRSEVIYFKKNELVEKIFADANKVIEKPGIVVKNFAGQTPDELGINISLAINNVTLPEFKPAYWHRLYGEGKGLPQIMYDYYLMSVGGNFATGVMKDCYNKVCLAAHRKLGLQFLFSLQSKKHTIPERLKM